MAFIPLSDLLATLRRPSGPVPGGVQRGPATYEDAVRGRLWQEPEEDRYRASEPAPSPSADPFADPLSKASVGGLLADSYGAAAPQTSIAQSGSPQGLLATPAAPSPAPAKEIDIQGHTYEAIPPEQFNHDMYDLMERYHGPYARPNPPTFLLGNDPSSKDQSPATIKYWRRKAAPFYGS